ncbi:hypothetical protein LIA77_04516 [Sarocladium implicatum]|nr:hypothetical protein LIA77_04516 [Sarocladium implicatum]
MPISTPKPGRSTPYSRPLSPLAADTVSSKACHCPWVLAHCTVAHLQYTAWAFQLTSDVVAPS